MSSSIINFNKLAKHITERIVQYLDPQSISNLVLTSRETRESVGKVIKNVNECQKKLCLHFIKSYTFTKALLEYKTILKECEIFRNESVYIDFVNKLNYKNRFYYINFFSAVLNTDVKIHNNNLLDVQKDLSKLSNEVYISLFQLQFSMKIPKLQTQMILCEQRGDYQTSQIFLFINNFLKQLKALQMMDNPVECMIGYSQGQKYLKQFYKLSNVKIEKQYQQKIYYLKFGKNYHQIINFNLNSKVLSFLDIKDLQKLRQVNKIFNNLVISTISILKNNLDNQITLINEQVNEKQIVKQITQQISQNPPNQISQYEFLTQTKIIFQSEDDLKLFKIYLQLLGYDTQTLDSQSLSNDQKVYLQISKVPYDIEINQNLLEILDKYFKEASNRQYNEYNQKLCKVMQNNLYILYQMKKNNVTYKQILECDQSMNIVDKKAKYLKCLVKFQSLLNKKYQQSQSLNLINQIQ